MSDSDGRIIPLVEDDQGEGVKDFIDDMDDYVKHWKDVLKPQDNNPILEHLTRKLRGEED